MKNRFSGLLFLVISWVMFFSGPVLLSAEEKTGSESKSDEFTLEEITVTAEKSEENLQKVSRSLTVITAQDLDIRATENVRQVLQTTAGISFYTGPHNQIMVRGVGTVTDDVGLEPSVQFNIDGNAQISTGGFGMKPMLQATNDVERVEVLRGPSGSVNGRSAAAGTVNIISKSPDFEKLDGNVQITVGNYNTIRMNAAMNLPLKLTGLDLPSYLERLSFRIALAEDKHEGYVHNSAGEPTAGMQNTFNVRARMKWQPIDPLTINVVYTATADASQSWMNVPAIDVDAPGLFPGGPFSSTAHPDDPWLNVTGTKYGKIDPSYQYSESVEVSYETGFGTFTGRYGFTWVPVECNPGDTNCYEGKRGQQDYELRLNSPEDSKIKWNLGAYYFHKKEYTGPDSQIGQIDPDRDVTFIDIYGGGDWGTVDGNTFDPTLPISDDTTQDWYDSTYINDTSLPFITTYKPARVSADYQNNIFFESANATRPIDAYSVFANATIPLFEDMHRLVLGARKNIEKKKRMISVGVWGYDAEGTNNGYPHFHWEQNTTGDTSRGQWICDNCYLIDAEQPKEFTTKDNPFNWTLGWEYDWQPDVMLYVMLSNGFKPGGFAPNAVPNRYYKPETVTNYAIGMKSRWFDQRLQLNVEAFLMDYKNYQMNLNINEGPVTYTLNGVDYLQPYVGMSAVTWNFNPIKIPGLDIDYDWVITGSDRIRGNIEFKHGRYNGVNADLGHGTFPPDAPRYPDYDGRPMAFSPDFTFYGSYTHMFNFGNYSITPQFDAKYSSKYFLFYEYWWGSMNPETWQKAYWKFDAFMTIGTQDGIWNVNLYCRNLTEEVVRNASFFAGTSIEEPRTYGASVRVKF